MDQLKIGTFIAVLRKEKGMTQERLAEALGVTQKSVSRWETGRNMPDLSLLRPLAETLGVSVPELLEGERANAPETAETKRAVVRLLDYAAFPKRRWLAREANFITGVFALLLAALLLIGVFMQRLTLMLVILYIALALLLFRFIFCRCPGCGRMLPFILKGGAFCPRCGLDLRRKGEK